jgi:hypothetical protein
VQRRIKEIGSGEMAEGGCGELLIGGKLFGGNGLRWVKEAKPWREE